MDDFQCYHNGWCRGVRPVLSLSLGLSITDVVWFAPLVPCRIVLAPFSGTIGVACGQEIGHLATCEMVPLADVPPGVLC